MLKAEVKGLAIIWLGLSLITSALPFLIGTVYYMVADDYLLNYIANGSYGTEYSAHLSFICVPVGVLLRFLYSITTSVNWYFVMLIGLIVLSFAVMYYTIWRRTKSILLLILCMLVNYYAVAEFLSFTVAAYLSAAAACCILCEALREKKNITAGGFVFVGFMLISFYLRRAAAAESLLIFALPILIAVLPAFKAPLPGRAAVLKKLTLPACAAVILFLLSVFIQRQAFSSEEWREFRRFDDARSAVVDNYIVPYKRVKKQMQEIGVSKLDDMLAQGWLFVEKSFFDEERLNAMAEINKKGVTIADRNSYAKRQLNKEMIPFLVSPILFALLLVLTGRLRHRLAALLQLLLGAGLLFAFSWIRMRFVMRVVAPTQLLTCIALLLLTELPLTKSDEKLKPKRLLAEGIGTALLAASLFQYMGYFRQVNYVTRINHLDEAYRPLTEEIISHPDTLYIFDAAALSVHFYFGTPAAQVKTTDIFNNVIRGGSWESFSPRFYSQVRAFTDRPDDLLTGLVREDSIVFVSDRGGERICEFYKEQTGREAVAEGQSFPETSLVVWRFREAPPAA